MTKPQDWVPPTRKSALPSGYSYMDYRYALEARNHFKMKRAGSNPNKIATAMQDVARNSPVTREAWNAMTTHAQADRDEAERRESIVTYMMQKQGMTRERAEATSLNFGTNYRGVTFQDDLVRDVIEEAHQARYVDSVIAYSNDWFDYNMQYNHQSSQESDAQLAAILAMDKSTDPYVKAAYDARDTSEWGKDLKANFAKAYDNKYHPAKQNAFVDWLEHTLPKLTGTSAIGSAIGAATHLEQAAEGKEEVGDAFLGAADTIGTAQGLEGVATNSIDAYKGANTAPGGVVGAAFSPFSTLEQNQGGRQFAELVDETGLNEYLNGVEESIRARGEGYGPAADLFSATVHTISNPANALMVAGYYMLAAPLELEAAITGDPRAKDYVEAFARDMGFQTAKDLADKDINVGEDINSLLTMLMMGKLSEVRAGKSPELARTELSKEAKTMKDYNLTPAEYKQLTEGRAGKAATIGELTEAVQNLPDRVADITIGKEPTRGVKITHPGEVLPEGWSYEYDTYGTKWKDPEGVLHDTAPTDVEGYHPGNILPESASIARAFAEDTYRQAGARTEFDGWGESGWNEIGGSGRTITKEAYDSFTGRIRGERAIKKREWNRLPPRAKRWTAEELENRRSPKTIDDEIAVSEKALNELTGEFDSSYWATQEMSNAYYAEDINALARNIEELRGERVDADMMEWLVEYNKKTVELDAEEAAYNEHTPSDTKVGGQEISVYRNANGEHYVAYRGNMHTTRDFGAIGTMALGLEELNPRMNAAVQSVLDIVDGPDYNGAPIYLTGQSLGGATALYVNEWLGINRPEVNIESVSTFGAGSSEFGRGGVAWDEYYQRHVGDASQWQQRTTNYNIAGDAIAEQPTPYGRLEVFEAAPGAESSDFGWSRGSSLADIATERTGARHAIDAYPVEEGHWWSPTEAPGRAAANTRPRGTLLTEGYNQPTTVEFYGERPSIKLRVMRKAIKEARPFNLDALDPATVDQLQQSGIIRCDVETDECTYIGDPDMSELTALIGQTETIEQTASDYQEGGGDGNRDDRVTRVPPGEEEAVEAMVNADGIIKPSGTKIFPTGPSGAQYVCTANSPFDCKIIQPGISSGSSSGTIGTRPGLEVIGFSQVVFPPGVTSMFVVYNPVTGVVVY